MLLERASIMPSRKVGFPDDIAYGATDAAERLHFKLGMYSVTSITKFFFVTFSIERDIF